MDVHSDNECLNIKINVCGIEVAASHDPLPVLPLGAYTLADNQLEINSISSEECEFVIFANCFCDFNVFLYFEGFLWME